MGPARVRARPHAGHSGSLIPMFHRFVVLAAVLGLVACGSSDEEQTGRKSRVQMDVGVDVPTREEAEEAARDAIDEDNADAALEELRREIESDRGS